MKNKATEKIDDNENNSVFEVFSFDRNIVKWEDYLYKLTPVKYVEDSNFGSMHFKLENYFAPLGAGCTNGSKLRQGVYLINTYAKEKDVVISGLAMNSPSHFHIPALAKHYGKKSIEVIGNTIKMEKFNSEMLKCSSYLGSFFIKAKCNYNNVIQKTVHNYKKQNPNTYAVEYAITLFHRKHSAKEIFDFHKIGAYQCKNIPSNIERIVMAYSSGNCATSVFLGILQNINNFPKLKYIDLVGTAPNAFSYLKERLIIMDQFVDIKSYDVFNFGGNNAKIKVSYYDTFFEKKYTYSQVVKSDFGDVELFGRYEAKVMDFIKNNFIHYINPDTLFWVVGADMSLDSLKSIYPDGYTGVPKELFFEDMFLSF